MPVELVAPQLSGPSPADLDLSNLSTSSALLRLLTVVLIMASTVVAVFNLSSGPIADTEQQEIIGP